jgi:hypothetical protein
MTDNEFLEIARKHFSSGEQIQLTRSVKEVEQKLGEVQKWISENGLTNPEGKMYAEIQEADLRWFLYERDNI